MATPTSGARFCGREFTPSEMDLIREVIETCSGLSRMELAQTVPASSTGEQARLGELGEDA